MGTQSNRSWQLALLLALSAVSFACGDDAGSGDGDVPDLTGNNTDGENTDGENNGGSDGENNGTDNNGGDNGGTTANGGNATAGNNAPEDKCVKAPKTSAEYLNSCAPTGVESRVFNNVERLPSSYEPGKLPAL